MNSIEVVSNPEKKSPEQIADGPILRVFIKEGSVYTLQNETTNYQQAMKLAEKFHNKDGKDILVNEKNNPNIVHAKTNRNKDIDVGREIRPNETQGVSVMGPGEVVLSSFYTKLPMDTKDFDERKRAIKDSTKAGAEPAGHNESKSPEASQVGEVAKEQIKAKIKREAPEIGTKPKAVLHKTGYELPAKLLSAYTVKDGKFHDRESNALRFEDHGPKLSTPVEDRKVIAHMIEVAAAKNWGQLELKGTETFKQIAWLEAQSRGIQTKGYQPNERDLQQLEQLHQERGTNQKKMTGPDAPVLKAAQEQNEIVATKPQILSPDEKMRLDVATKVMEKALAKLPENIRVDAITKMVNAFEKGDLKLPTPMVTERAMDNPHPAPAPAMDRSR